jgi:acetate kinase
MGIRIDKEKNLAADGFNRVCEISPDDAEVKVLVVPTDEERMIAREVINVLSVSYVSERLKKQKQEWIPVEVSAHHVHLSREHVATLFGADYQLTIRSELSQPGQFACHETVDLIGPRGTVERVRILGPERRESQVEISMTEQYKLGIHPPIRESGDLEGTPGLTIRSEQRKVELARGVICALRHIHMSPLDAMNFGLKNRDIVRVFIEGARELEFGDVVVRVSPDYALAMHLDTDEANAAGISTGAKARITHIQQRA